MKGNIYQLLQKDKKHKKLEYEAFNQVIEDWLLPGTIFTKTNPGSFYIWNGNIITKNFNDVTLIRQDINEKWNKIQDLNHRFEILSKVSKLKLNDINRKITSIDTSLNNITSIHKGSYKTQDNKTIITQNRSEILIGSNESNTNGCHNDNNQLPNDVTASTLSQVNLRNDDVKKDLLNIKTKQNRNEKGSSVTVVVGDSVVKKVKGWELWFIYCQIIFSLAKSSQLENNIVLVWSVWVCKEL